MTDLITMNNAAIAYKDASLVKATRTILSLAESMRTTAFSTAIVIAQVHEQQCFRKDGFKNVHEWTSSAFGLAKSQSYNLLKIGTEWTAPITGTDGKVIAYRSILYPFVEEGDPDFNVSQLALLLPLGKNDAINLVKERKIRSTMSIAEMRKIVNSLKPQKEDEEDNIGEGNGNANESAGEVIEKRVYVTDEQGTVYAVPVEVLKKYIDEKATEQMKAIKARKSVESSPKVADTKAEMKNEARSKVSKVGKKAKK